MHTSKLCPKICPSHEVFKVMTKDMSKPCTLQSYVQRCVQAMRSSQLCPKICPSHVVFKVMPKDMFKSCTLQSYVQKDVQVSKLVNWYFEPSQPTCPNQVHFKPTFKSGTLKGMAKVCALQSSVK